MKKIIQILIILFTSKILACTCFEINKENISTVYKNSDYVIIGTVIENINPKRNKYFELEWNRNKTATEVKIKVETILKGEIHTEIIFINQFFTGNCSEYFKLGQKYLIAGNQIKKFINEGSKNIHRDNVKKKNEIKITRRVAKSNFEFENNILRFSNIEIESIRYWNKLAKKGIVIYTNTCISGKIDSYFSKEFLKEIK